MADPDLDSFATEPASPVVSTEAQQVQAEFCIVGIGCSAGGLDATLELLGALRPDTGLAFVLVQHLSPKHVSNLAHILSRATRMPVTQVEDEPAVEANHVYVIPPGKTMTLSGNRLRLEERPAVGVHQPVDAFFKSLARQQGHKSIAVVLSGTGADGTVGLEEIKAAGGITMAQDAHAAHGGMPGSAISSGCVDLVLSPQAIAAELDRIAGHPYVLPASAPKPAAEAAAGDLKPVLKALRQAGGIDFAHYKPTTLERRISRRMLLRGKTNVQEYIELLQSEPAEAHSLFEDVLIGVTEFFRDPQMYEALKRDVLPRLVSKHSSDDPLRVWVLGCSSGEEAYSLAMALSEFIEEKMLTTRVQIFATDVNDTSIDRARKGVYSAAAVAHIGEDRLGRFFSRTNGSYVISKRIRDMCLFARHDMTSAPPFSRIDLISCRNVLIYFGAELQKKMIAKFHYALNPDGWLILGRSESLGGRNACFDLVDATHKFFVRKHVFGRADLHVVGAAGPSPPPALSGQSVSREPAAVHDLQTAADSVLLASQPPSVLIDARMEIVHFRGDTSAFFATGQGKASFNAFKMARQGVLMPLRGAIEQAQETGATTEAVITVGTNGAERSTLMQVVPLSTGSQQGFLVVFRPTAPSLEAGSEKPPAGRERAGDAHVPDDSSHVSQLERELAQTRAYLESVIAQYEAANQELSAANEEVLSANEELQSVNEELETSKEEMQSANEELLTLNEEVNRANRELERTGNDLVNVLNCMEVPLVIVSREQRIRRYTPAAERLFRLIPGDIGRPLTDINLSFRVPDFVRAMAEVIGSGTVREFEVQDGEGRLSWLRIRPYQTLDNRIDGAVLMLLDVDKLRRARDFAENIVATVREPLLVLNVDFKVEMASRSFYSHFYTTEADTRGRVFFRLGGGEWDTAKVRQALDAVFKTGEPFENVEVQADFRRLGPRVMVLNGRLLLVEREAPPLLLLSIEDQTERERRGDTGAGLAEVQRHDNAFLAMLAHELRNPLAPMKTAMEILRTGAATPEMKSAADTIVMRQLDAMTRLIGDLMDAARIQHGKISFHNDLVDLKEILRQCAETTGHRFGPGDRAFGLDLPDDPVYVLADPIRLAQAFGNLLHNAFKFTPREGKISLTAELRAAAPGQAAGRVVVSVRDNGAGIRAEHLPKIFEMFAQADSTLDRRHGGLGIGLTLARTIIEECGGFIEAHSAGAGLGSEFVVNLPTSAAPEVAAVAEQAGSTRPARRILLVDDNKDAAESLATLLRLRGNQVTTAYDGQTAIALQTQSRWDVVILDIGLPGMNGYELASHLRKCENTAHSQFFALSGYDRGVSQLQTGIELFDHYLTKPVSVKDIEGLLKR